MNSPISLQGSVNRRLPLAVFIQTTVLVCMLKSHLRSHRALFRLGAKTSGLTMLQLLQHLVKYFISRYRPVCLDNIIFVITPTRISVKYFPIHVIHGGTTHASVTDAQGHNESLLSMDLDRRRLAGTAPLIRTYGTDQMMLQATGRSHAAITILFLWMRLQYLHS